MGLGAGAAAIPGLSSVGTCYSVGVIHGVDKKYMLHLALMMQMVFNAGMVCYDLWDVINHGFSSILLEEVAAWGVAAVGAVAGTILPASVRVALGVMLYGMFIAIVVPQAKREKAMLICLVLSMVFSCLFTWLPLLKQISSGLAIVICTVAAAAICAALFPIADEEVADQ